MRIWETARRHGQLHRSAVQPRPQVRAAPRASPLSLRFPRYLPSKVHPQLPETYQSTYGALFVARAQPYPRPVVPQLESLLEADL